MNRDDKELVIATLTGCVAMFWAGTELLRYQLHPWKLELQERAERVLALSERRFDVCDSAGRVVFRKIAEDMYPFKESRAAFKRHGLWGFLDRTGREVIPCAFSRVLSFQDGMASVWVEDRCGMIDRNGRWVVPARFDNVYNASDGLIHAKVGGKWGIVDRSGKWLIQPEYQHLLEFSEGLAVAGTEDRMGFIDKTGKWIVQPSFESLNSMSEGLAAARSGQTWGFVDRTGSWKIRPKFQSVRDFHEGLAAFSEGDQWGLLDTAGNVAIAPQFPVVYMGSEVRVRSAAPTIRNGEVHFDVLGKSVTHSRVIRLPNGKYQLVSSKVAATTGSPTDLTIRPRQMADSYEGSGGAISVSAKDPSDTYRVEPGEIVLGPITGRAAE